MTLELPSKLSDDKLNEPLPALSLLAEDVGEKGSLDSNGIREILLSVNLEHEIWAEQELNYWLNTLDKAKGNPNKTQEDSAIADLKSRGVPEFPAVLAVYVATNQTSTPQSTAPEISLPISSKEKSTNQPVEPFHKLLPDHGWHNDLTWEQLPGWIKRNPQLIARLNRGEQVVGKNVRYRFVAQKLIRLRYRIPVAVGYKPHGNPVRFCRTYS